MSIERQALSDRHKEAVKAWVPKVRKIIEKDLAAQLERLGISTGGGVTPVERMNLSDEAKALRLRVEALLQRDTISEGDAGRGYQAILREISYTFLNRLVGLKCMEVRRVLYLPPPGDPEAEAEQTEVLTPVPGQARSRYLRDTRAAGGARYKYEEDAEEALLRDALTAAFRHITREIRILYDPEHEYSSLWPTHACLQEAIAAINGGLPEEAYGAPDFPGWVYQFFNREEKKQVREESRGTPRSSYELAVINQFYTPSWIVKVLVDNTLGRLWIQMHPDSSLRSQGPPPLPEERTSAEPVADYLVPGTGEKLRFRRLSDAGLVEEFKHAREIALLDPACGAMHFGQYAFGLFYRMYEEEIENAGKPGWPAEPSVGERSQIPTAVIENNLFGIDIDPRAIQIASLSLLLTAKEAALRHGDDPRRVRISRTNLVVANAADLGKEQVRALVARVNGRFGTHEMQRRLFETLWENLRNVGELGSLVQVKEGVSRVLEEWVEDQARLRGWTDIRSKHPQQRHLFEARITRQLMLQRRVLEEEADRLRHELLSALENAAGKAEIDPSGRLFAEDTARGLKLMQTLSRSYDVVVMNPPYGAFVPKVKDFVRVAYPLTYNDIYAAFIDRATQLVEPEGYVGALVSSTFVNLKTFEKLRTEILLKRNPLIVMLDLGFGILDDATVETAAVVLRGGSL